MAASKTHFELEVLVDYFISLMASLVERLIPWLAKMSMRPVHMLGHWMAEWSAALAVATATTIAAESRKQHSNQTGGELLKMCVLCFGLCLAMGLLSLALRFLDIKKVSALFGS